MIIFMHSTVVSFQIFYNEWVLILHLKSLLRSVNDPFGNGGQGALALEAGVMAKP